VTAVVRWASLIDLQLNIMQTWGQFSIFDIVNAGFSKAARAAAVAHCRAVGASRPGFWSRIPAEIGGQFTVDTVINGGIGRNASSERGHLARSFARCGQDARAPDEARIAG
jgi:hypothetical protein